MLKKNLLKKTDFSREMKRLALRILLGKFCQAVFDVKGVSIKKLCEQDDETGENMGVAGKIFRSTEIKLEVTESKLSLLLKHNIMHAETVMNSYCVLIIR